MELEEVYRLINKFEDSGIGKLIYKENGCEITLEARAAASQPLASAASHRPASVPPPEQTTRSAGVVRAPLVGTYYAGSGEGSQPFVKPGATVKKGQTLCIIEAMKMMNEVPAPCDCVIEEILKENASAAGFDEPLFKIREL